MDGKGLLSNLGKENIADQVTQVYDTIFTVSESSYVEEIYTNSDGQETMRGVLSYNQDYIRTKAEAYASTYDSSRSANEYVLECGVSRPTWTPETACWTGSRTPTAIPSWSHPWR